MVKRYSNLFGQEIEEDEADQGTEDGDGEGIGGFGSRWGYVAMIDRVSEAMKINWHEVMDLNVYEYLNVLSYLRDKAEDEKRRLEQFRRKH